ncbi:MAG: hypothetical protein IPK16_18795 [Anaerolineales bacterium]|nr:hypothetical protein [Anaerolineales bacterium]
MPRLSVWFVRASLIYLMVGFTLGALLLANKGVFLHPLVWRLLPAHIELLLMGWVVLLALGVAFWILPRWQTKRGNEKPAWAALLLINLGLWCVIAAAWLPGYDDLLWWGRSLEALGVAAFAFHAWPRVKPWVEG